MRVCFYNLTAGFKSGGLETYCWEVGRALVAQGHEAHIIGGEGGLPRNDEVKLIALPYRNRSSFPNFGTRFRKFAERLSMLRSALPILRAGNYDAIVINKPYDFPALAMLRRYGFKGVTAFRSGGTDYFAGDRLLASAVDLWLSTSAFNAAQIESRYGRPVTVIHNGVDPDKFALQARDATLRLRLGIPDSAVMAVSVGRLIGLKGLHIIVQALRSMPNLHYLVVGDGKERDRLAALAADQGTSDRLHFMGEVKHRELPAVLAAADLFVQPSIGEEAFGISVVEAMSVGLPVLASNQGGLREVVVDGKTGLLLPPGDLGAWTEALKQLDSPQRRLELGAAGRARVLECFTWAQNASKLAAMFESSRRAA